ncbi:MAG: H-NS family nucleoid-associated regulatory protein [Hyphomicrobiaceae bacterium]
MATVNLDKLSLEELEDLDVKLQKALVQAREQERSDVKEKIEALAQSSGFSVADLFGARYGGRGKSAPIKYQNPNDRSETWTGRGRKPKWLVAKLEEGARMEDFQIR